MSIILILIQMSDKGYRHSDYAFIRRRHGSHKAIDHVEQRPGFSGPPSLAYETLGR